jgi:hypothetical protein
VYLLLHGFGCGSHRQGFNYPGNMDRAKGVSPAEAGWLTKIVFRALRKNLGLIPKTKALAAHHPPTLLAATWMGDVCAKSRTVPLVLKELVQLKVAMLAGCPF